MTRMGARAVERRRIYATVRALLEVLEILVGQAPTDRLARQILEEVKCKFDFIISIFVGQPAGNKRLIFPSKVFCKY
jgi:hypothetical protein